MALAFDGKTQQMEFDVGEVEREVTRAIPDVIPQQIDIARRLIN